MMSEMARGFLPFMDLAKSDSSSVCAVFFDDIVYVVIVDAKGGELFRIYYIFWLASTGNKPER